MYQEKPEPQPKRPASRLRAGSIALLLVIGLTIIARVALLQWEKAYLPSLAQAGEDQVVKGLVLTREALSQSDELLLFGSSELTVQDDYHPVRLFAAKPTGFSCFVIGSGYRQSLHNALALGALGTGLKGKRIVLFVSPTWFDRTMSAWAFRKNFSQLQAYETLFVSPDSPDTKRRIARRLLSLGSPATDDPLLRATLQALSEGDLWGQVRFYAIWPLARLSVEFQRLRDEVQLARLILTKRLPPVKPARKQAIDWVQLTAKAEAEAREKTTSNPFGIRDDYYHRYYEFRLEQAKGSAVHDSWHISSEYDDLQLVLDTLKETGARPLFISLPVSGPWFDFKGHPLADRKAYYARVKGMIEGSGYPVVDLSSNEYESGFMSDPWHQGWKGGVVIARTLDQFYHQGVPAPQ